MESPQGSGLETAVPTSPSREGRRIPVLLMVRELGFGGTERQTAATALSLDRRMFEPHVAAFRPYGVRAGELREAGIPVAKIPVTSLFGPSALFGAAAMGRYIRRHGISVVHTFDAPMNVYAPLVARMFQTPVVLSSQRMYRDLNVPWIRTALRFSDRVVDGVVVNCLALGRHMSEDERNPASRNLLCYNGIDTAVFRPGERILPPALDGAGLVAGVVCSLRPEKNLEILLQGFALFRRRRPDARLAIVGSGPMLEPLRKLAGELELAGACHFEPGVGDVVPWLRAMDIFALPSRSEALSNSLMEAMACGCCCVASDVGGNPELVVPMDTGLLFRAGDAADLAAKLELLAGDPVARRSLAERGAARIAGDFSLEAAGRRMGEIYLSMLGRS